MPLTCRGEGGTTSAAWSGGCPDGAIGRVLLVGGRVSLVLVSFVTVAACRPVPLSFCLGVLVGVFSLRVSLCVFQCVGLVWFPGLFVGLRLLFGGGKALG
jgi:hypothetical protein